MEPIDKILNVMEQIIIPIIILSGFIITVWAFLKKTDIFLPIFKKIRKNKILNITNFALYFSYYIKYRKIPKTDKEIKESIKLFVKYYILVPIVIIIIFLILIQFIVPIIP